MISNRQLNSFLNGLAVNYAEPEPKPLGDDEFKAWLKAEPGTRDRSPEGPPLRPRRFCPICGDSDCGYAKIMG